MKAENGRPALAEWGSAPETARKVKAGVRRKQPGKSSGGRVGTSLEKNRAEEAGKVRGKRGGRKKTEERR